MLQSMSDVIQIEHPLIEHSLTILRDHTTETSRFRRHADIVSQILVVEATRHLRTREKVVETPIASFAGAELDEQIVAVPVLRAGLAMLMTIQDFLPQVGIGFVGLERDEETAVAREYYKKLPDITPAHHVLVLDPMLATGGSLDDTVTILRERNPGAILLVCIVAAPEGIKRIQTRYPDVTILTAAIDDHLNEQKYIVPGLGDFGDRYFGT